MGHQGWLGGRASREGRGSMHHAMRTVAALVSIAALAFAAASVGSPAPLRAATTVVLHCTIVDAASGIPIPSRCRIIDMYGTNRYPPLWTCFYRSAVGGYFYSGGSFSCIVPPGPVVLTVRRGLEYREIVDSLTVRADTSIVVGLARMISMDGLGWYGGDSHVHINHAGGYYVLLPEDAHLMASAEGLSIVNCLDNDYYFTGAPASCSTPDCWVYMSEEMRSSSYGHVGLLALRSIVSPVSSAWWPMTMDIADSAHAQQGALVISAHPVPSDNFTQVEAWPGSGIARELPVDCVTHRVDAVDVLSYSNLHDGGIELDTWYRLLNCGFRLPASAGTDATMNRLDSGPLGAFRVYARITGDVVSPEAWFEALAAGKTFVTNGPLITSFTVGGLSSGDSCRVAEPGSIVSGRISVRSVHAISRVEIVRNGTVAATLNIEPPREAVDTSFSVSLFESSWVAARVYGDKRGWITAGNFLFAHTSPVYFTVHGRRVLVREDAEFFERYIEDLELLARTKGQWPDTLQSSRVFRELAAARLWYEALAHGGVSSVGHGTPSALRCENAPNPFGGATVIAFEVPGSTARPAGGNSPGSTDSPVTLAIYDVSGRVLRRLVGSPLSAGVYRVSWDGRDGRGREVPSGIYFARLSAGGRAFNRKMIRIR